MKAQSRIKNYLWELAQSEENSKDIVDQVLEAPKSEEKKDELTRLQRTFTGCIEFLEARWREPLHDSDLSWGFWIWDYIFPESCEQIGYTIEEALETIYKTYYPADYPYDQWLELTAHPQPEMHTQPSSGLNG